MHQTTYRKPLDTLRAGRLATFVYFGLNGFLLGMWIVHIPAIAHRTEVSHAVLGWLLLLLGAGAFAGMQVVGPLTDRFGARTVVPVSAALFSVALVLPGIATDAWTLGAALLLVGCGNGAMDVSMNVHAVQVERGYGRPVMSAFHATFSIGGVLAALVGAATLSLGWNAALTLGSAAAAGIAVSVACRTLLLRPERAPSPGTDTAAEPTRTPRRIWIMAALALMLMLCEGVANDWSALHLRDILGASAATAAFAYGAFATAMTVGRFLADGMSARFGAIAILRYGAAIAAIGLAIAAMSPWIPVALIGWTIAGIGLSGCVPQLFSAAGHADQTAAGSNVARVAGIGYLGVLAGPAVIGPMTHFMPLNITFLLPVALCAVTACAAGVLREKGTA
ncbi:MFS transporter [Nocardia goodfellowii]|uniref:MFS family permease n=1 Tax=Nocardia goodfellowii TaxID=882446 RepID=A0ABS4QHF1_9NOCA|nr:MFS transporter [Nocardia goodfellowii]MBP2191112.1 MFS family permease [Nocardia goodfellowii]